MLRWLACAVALMVTGCGTTPSAPGSTSLMTTLMTVAPTSTNVAAVDMPIVDADQDGSGRTVAYVTDVAMDDGRAMATIDFARMLSGIEAEQAARAAGALADGEDLPNDFYISNTDPTTNRVEVAANAELEIQGCFEGGPCPTFVPVTVTEWVALHTGESPGTLPDGFSWYGGGMLYGIAIADGVVTTLVEQYLP